MRNNLFKLLVSGLQVDTLKDAQTVDVMLLRVAYHRIPLTTALAALTVAFFGPMYYSYFFTNGFMLVWIALVLSNYALAAVVFYGFRKTSLNQDSVPRWSRIFVAANVCSGLCWSFGPVLFIHHHFDGGEAAILVVSLLAVSGVTMALVLGQRLALTTYLATALLPTALVLLIQGGAVANTLALLLVTSAVAFSAVGFDFNHALKRLCQTQIQLALAAREASQAKEQAERSTALKSQFVANVSHEIRTPMHAILGMLKLLQNADLNQRQADYASKVEGTARSLLGLLDDILDFSKIEAERMDLSLHPFRMDRMLHDLSVVLMASAQNKPVEVLYDIDPSIPKVLLGDAMRLRQVLLNLAGNAVKFTKLGEVVLRIQLVKQSGYDYTLHFSVKDSGVGIAPENLDRIFSEFGQAEGEQRSFGGTGLGLSISKRLVSMMGGVLQVRSTPGLGSDFYFDLTFQALETHADAMPRSPDTGVDLQVLVIDGGDTARELAANMCRSWGWAVETAASGEQALSMLRERMARQAQPFDVVIVDWTLPGMDGWQTVEAMQALCGFGPAPDYVVLSGFGHEHLLERPQSDVSRMGSFLPKPFTASMLFDSIAQARASARAKPRSPQQSAKRKQRLSGVRVLVVEDNLMNQQVVQELLELEGATVKVVENGQQAVDLLASFVDRNAQPFDAVLMDLQMPNMDGYAATRIIRNELGLHNLPVIAITANMMSADKEASFSAGMNAHIGKPFNIDLLVRVIQKEHAVSKG